MGKCNLSGGGVRSNLRAEINIPMDRVWKYSTTENLVTLCGAGQMADGICIGDADGVLEGEILNLSGGQCHSRKDTGVYDEVAYSGTDLTIGEEWMSGALGVVTAYVSGSDHRALGKVLAVNTAAKTAKITMY